MTTKFPPISDEIREGTKKIDLGLKPREDLPDEAIELQARSIGQKWGSSTQLATSPAPAPKPTAPLVSVRFDAPDYLDKALSIRAAEQGVTKTYLILQALRNSGLRLDEVDLVKDRRRLRR